MKHNNGKRFEVIQGGRKNDDEREVVRQNSPLLQLLRGGQKGWKEKIEDSARIKEERIFKEEEILNLIQQVAEKEGFKKDDLEIESKVYDGNNNLIVLAVRVRPGRAHGAGYGQILYEFMIKGNHGKTGFNEDTSIVRVYASVDNPGEFFSGGIVGKYANGEWELTPGNISPTVSDISPKE